MIKLLKPFLMICFALLFLAGCVESQNSGVQSMEPYVTPAPVVSVAPAPPQTAATASSPTVKASPGSETVWPVTLEAPFDPAVYPLSASDERLFRNVFGNAAATIYAEVADFCRAYVQRKADLADMDIEAAGRVETEMDNEWQ